MGPVRPRWQTTENNRRARVYELTAAGRKQLASEEQRWTSITAAIGLALKQAFSKFLCPGSHASLTPSVPRRPPPISMKNSQFHLDQRVADLEKSGRSRQDAERIARRQFGNRLSTTGSEPRNQSRRVA